MVRTLAGENAAHGITVNAILPGLVATEQVLSMPPDVRERATQVNGQTIAVDGGASLSQLTLGSERR
jgi:NAD(P)-dependent dehydrogenase (short-subunit alcohol dehydrogenase family)